MNEIKEKHLVKRLQKREEAALFECIDEYTPLLKTIIYKRLYFLPEDKEEVLNDVFLKIWENIDSYHPKKGTFRQWICAIANYEAIDRLRKVYEKEMSLPLDEDILSKDKTPEDELLSEELYTQLLELLNVLSPEDRDIFLELFFKGRSYEEVSEKFGIKISNLYNKVSRSRKVLRKVYKEGLK
ncbi:MAG: sigma-70 family RNA polymerase sigma factor [Tissierellia bacterium]|nr:sigma-70 family RNA polymerase sigma factor [Tissierellia bacterium]